MLHHIFQRQGIPPDEFYRKPYKVRAFMLASMRLQIEIEEEQLRQLEMKQKEGGRGNGRK